MKYFLFLFYFNSIVNAASTESKELVLNCSSAVYLARELAKKPFNLSNWFWGEVTVTGSVTEDTLLPSGLPGEVLIRKVRVSAKSLPGIINLKTKSDVQFRVVSDPFIKNPPFFTTSEWRFVELKKWRWYDIPGLLLFQFVTNQKDENTCGSPCKLPRQWISFFTDAAALREKYLNWFSLGPGADVSSMREEITTTNPLWRLCVMCRLLELKQLRREDTVKLLEISAGKLLELGALLGILLKEPTSHEEEIMKIVRTHGRDSVTSEGLALGCLTSAADKPKAIERAFDSLKLLGDLKSKGEASMQDKENMIDAVFQGDVALEYRIVHKLNVMITDVDKDLRQKFEAIVFLC